MKKYIYIFLAAFLAAMNLTSCTEDEGTEPGNDPNPVVTIYQYEASSPNNPDNDVVLRLAANNKTNEAYYLVEKTADKTARLQSLGESGYAEYVVANGSKVEGIAGVSDADLLLTDLYGPYTITVVAVNGASMTSSETTFIGLEWADVVTGTYLFNAVKSLGLSPVKTVLQVCTTDDNLYRFKDVFGTGYSLKIKLIDLTDSDEDGEYRFFRIPKAATPYNYGSYGAVGVRDVGYWRGSDSWVTEKGYESGMYEDHSCFLCIQYFVSAGNLGYGYDFFIPDAE